MLIEVTHTPVTEKGREIVQGASDDYQYTAMIADLNRYNGHATPWHWHEHYEIGYVKSGAISLCTERQTIHLGPGEGYFLNANVLHRSVAASSKMELHAQLFDKTVLTGTRHIARRYLLPVDHCFQIDALKLTPDQRLEKQMIYEMETSFNAANADGVNTEFLISAHLNLFWYALMQQIEPILAEGSGAEPRESIRMKQMLTFIHQHYTERISVSQITAEVGICERELYRCFSKTLGMTPITYINNYRIQQSAKMLIETSLSVAEIAEACGFASSSYYVNVFRRSMECTPAEYRRK